MKLERFIKKAGEGNVMAQYYIAGIITILSFIGRKPEAAHGLVEDIKSTTGFNDILEKMKSRATSEIDSQNITEEDEKLISAIKSTLLDLTLSKLDGLKDHLKDESEEDEEEN